MKSIGYHIIGYIECNCRWVILGQRILSSSVPISLTKSNSEYSIIKGFI